MTGLTDQERIDRLRLIRTESIGPVTFYRLMARFGSATRVLEALPHMAARGGKAKPLAVISADAAIQEIETLEKFGGRMVVTEDADYPAYLAMTEDAPPVLNIIGDVALLSRSCVAVVGARNASANARRLTQKLAQDMGTQGQVIVSGMARGIDTAAHEAALDTGTIAVMAGGLDEIYPLENTDLYNAITERGCVVSEMPLGTKPTAHHFPRRNRIVSGLSKGVVVVEASIRSGSLITARLAAEQGREVFAVPGFPGDPRAEGPNSLIQNGAKLVTNAEDILSELRYIGDRVLQSSPAQSAQSIAEEASLFDYEQDTGDAESVQMMLDETLSFTPMEVDEIIRLSGLQAGYVQMCLLEMEIAGQVQRHPGNRVSKVA